MSELEKFDVLSEDIATKRHDFVSHVFKLCLTNISPSKVADASYTADIAPNEVAGGNGYASGGVTLVVTVAIVQGSANIDFDTVILQASGGSIGPYQFAVVYNDTTSGKPVVGYYTRQTEKTLPDGGVDYLDFEGSGSELVIG